MGLLFTIMTCFLWAEGLSAAPSAAPLFTLFVKDVTNHTGNPCLVSIPARCDGGTSAEVRVVSSWLSPQWPPSMSPVLYIGGQQNRTSS